MAVTNIITSFAQTFFVDATDTPDGIFLAAVDICFRTKDDLAPISVALTSTTNGYPDISKFYNASKIVVPAKDVNTSTGVGTDLPNFTDSTKYTRFTFEDPIYLAPGEHALLLQSNSVNYEAFIAKMDQLILGTERRVSKQPYSGSLFKSQNSSTWTAIQEEDLMFRLHRAKFRVNAPGKIYFRTPASLQPSSNRAYDAIAFYNNDINFGKTSTTYGYKSTNFPSGAIDTEFYGMQIGNLITPSQRKEVSNIAGSIRIETTLNSVSDYVSPIVDLTRVNSFLITNYINDGSLRDTLISITNAGTGYNSAALPTVTISAPTRTGGVQATAVANVTLTGIVDGIFILEQGSGYIETPTITISAPPVASGNTNATANISGETSQTGGNARARYITRRVTLADGFDARDLQVIITANKLQNQDIQVYYKVLSAEDPDQNFDNKYWVRMRLDSNIVTSAKNNLEFIEYRYVPSGAQAIPPTDITYTSGGVTYDTFRYYAIKICLYSNTTLNTPVVKNFRAIALE